MSADAVLLQYSTVLKSFGLLSVKEKRGGGKSTGKSFLTPDIIIPGSVF